VGTEALLDYLQPVFMLIGEHPYIKAIVVFALSLAIAKLIAHIAINFIGRLVQRTGNRFDDALINILHVPLFWTVVLMGTLLSITITQLPETAISITRSVVFNMLTVIWSIFTVRLLRIITIAMSERAGTHSLVRPQTLPLFNNIFIIIIVALAIYFMFQTWDIDMTAWVASAGIVGIAVGFAAKDTLANLFSGVFILADAPYKIGDYVVLESGERGKVTHIGIRSTRLLTRDDVEVTIPNSIMGNTRIVNESGGPHEKFRIRVQVGVAYGSDIDQIRDILFTIAIDELHVCNDPEPRVRFRAFGNSSLDFELLCWVDNPELRGRVLDRLNCTIYKRFMSEGIEIPYSKHDLYIKEMPKT